MQMVDIMPSTIDAVNKDKLRIWRPEPLVIKLDSWVTRIRKPCWKAQRARKRQPLTCRCLMLIPSPGEVALASVPSTRDRHHTGRIKRFQQIKSPRFPHSG